MAHCIFLGGFYSDRADSEDDEDYDDPKFESYCKYLGTHIDACALKEEKIFASEEIKTKALGKDLGKKVWEVRYDWLNKYHVVVYEEEDGWRLIMKGDVDVILPRCTKMRVKEDEEDFDESGREGVKNMIHKIIGGELIRSNQSHSYTKIILNLF